MTKWFICRPLMSNKFRNQTKVEFGSAILFEHRDAFPQLSLLPAAGLVIPVTNAGCERGFSCQNRIMTKLRNRLSKENIDCLHLMCILLEGPPMYQFNFERAFCMWKEHKARRLLGQHPGCSVIGTDWHIT